MQLYVFDAYGTLFDVHAAAERQKDSIGPKWKELSLIWRAKHLEYTWVYSLAGKQYLVIAAGGHGKIGTKLGDYVLAFTLP